MSIENFKIAKYSTSNSQSRLCGPLDDLEKHVASILRLKNLGECAVCGSLTYWKCGLCKKRICLGAGGKGCHIALHNDSMFGLAKCDFSEVHRGRQKEWTVPNVNAKRRNTKWIDYLRRQLLNNECEGVN